MKKYLLTFISRWTISFLWRYSRISTISAARNLASGSSNLPPKIIETYYNKKAILLQSYLLIQGNLRVSHLPDIPIRNIILIYHETRKIASQFLDGWACKVSPSQPALDILFLPLYRLLLSIIKSDKKTNFFHIVLVHNFYRVAFAIWMFLS